jgi:hypothetical protein
MHDDEADGDQFEAGTLDRNATAPELVEIDWLMSVVCDWVRFARVPNRTTPTTSIPMTPSLESLGERNQTKSS